MILEILYQRMVIAGLDQHNYRKVMDTGDATDVLEEADVKLAEDEQEE